MSRHLKTLFILTLISIVLMVGISVWKWNHFQFNTLDLAIYSQVLWNTGHGNILQSSIQGTNYFGDHFEPLLFPLSGLMLLIPHPLLLIILQTIALFGSSFLVYALAKKYCSPNVSLYCAIAYCINPVIWNIANTEFHMINFAVPLIFWSLLNYANKKYFLFLVSCLCLFLVREDVALAIAGLALLGLIERRSWKWWVIPGAAAIAWFALAVTLTSRLASGGYKFTVYYGWLGSSFKEILQTLFTRPWIAFAGLIDINNILLLLSLVLLFIGLPLFGKRSLVVVIPPLLQMLFGRFNPQLLFETHYLSMIIPLIFFVSIKGLSQLLKKDWRFLQKPLQAFPALPVIILFAILLYSFLFLGPLVGSTQAIASSKNMSHELDLLNDIPDESSVASSYGPLANLSTRASLYSLHYSALGHKQFSTEPYVLSPVPQFIALDLNDLTTFELQYASASFSKKEYATMYQRLQTLFNNYEITRVSGQLMLLRQSSHGNAASVLSQKLPVGQQTENISLDTVALLAHAKKDLSPLGKVITLNLRVQREDPDSTKGYALSIYDPWQPEKKTVVPFGWNLTPLFSLTSNDEIQMTIPVSDNLYETKKLKIELITREGYASLNGVGGASAVISKESKIASVDLEF